MKFVAAVVLAGLALAGCGGSSSATTQASTSQTTTSQTTTSQTTTSPAATTTTTRTVATSTTRKAPTPTGGGAKPARGCPSSSTVLVGVYHPYRLLVIDGCRHATGTVVSVTPEQDGDLHFDVRLDAAYQGMLAPGNYDEQHGALVVELMPRDHGHLPAPSVGDRVSITGAYVDDTDHHWSEIHPVWALSIDGGSASTSGPQYGGSPPAASSATAVESCRTNTGAACAGYGGATSSSGNKQTRSRTTSTGGSITSGGSTEIVHPGAFCSPEGARGVTSAGTPMTCKPGATDFRDRWRRS